MMNNKKSSFLPKASRAANILDHVQAKELLSSLFSCIKKKVRKCRFYNTKYWENILLQQCEKQVIVN